MRSAVLLLPFIIPGTLAAVSAGLLINATGRYREVILAGCFFLSLGNGLFCLFDAQSTLALIVGIQILGGIGAGLLFQPPLIALQAMVQQKDVATATGTLGFCRNLATSLSVVIGGVIFQNSMDRRSSTLKAEGLPDALVAQFSGRHAAANVYQIGAIQNPSWKLATEQAFAWSLRYVWILYTATAGCALISAFFIVSTKLSTEHVETKTGIQEKSTTEAQNQGTELN